MADYYTQFSVGITNLTAEEYVWWKVFYNAWTGLPECDFDDDIEEDRQNKEEYLKKYRAYGELALEIGYDSDGQRESSTTISVVSDCASLYSEESASPDFVIAAIQAFLKAHRPNQAVMVTWAYTRSRPRHNSFSGGGAVVTAEWVHWQKDDLEAIAATYEAEKRLGTTTTEEDIVQAVRNQRVLANE